uniref:Carbohydrate kinase PfkB domain-containing protein n=1 Tax=Haptolina brevifila TaxID=156173 RepID=A0A7S2BMF3_9EUKA|mmetsp:Transcript_1445/g.3061  ORF Transcript_1445/g.3061 Transcript_1445/m.3061 type:complete len:552 (+) Transcript_1445:1440-3095(+)
MLRFDSHSGGKALNTAVAAAVLQGKGGMKLEERVYLVGCIGSDSAGSVVETFLQLKELSSKVVQSHLYKSNDKQTGVACILNADEAVRVRSLTEDDATVLQGSMVALRGEPVTKWHLQVDGANADLSCSQVAKALQAVAERHREAQPPAVCCLQQELDMTVNLTALEEAKRLGLMTLLRLHDHSKVAHPSSVLHMIDVLCTVERDGFELARKVASGQPHYHAKYERLVKHCEQVRREHEAQQLNVTLNDALETREQEIEATVAIRSKLFEMLSSEVKCASPNCAFLAHSDSAAWNDFGHYCCRKCREHGSEEHGLRCQSVTNHAGIATAVPAAEAADGFAAQAFGRLAKLDEDNDHVISSTEVSKFVRFLSDTFHASAQRANTRQGCQIFTPLLMEAQVKGLYEHAFHGQALLDAGIAKSVIFMNGRSLGAVSVISRTALKLPKLPQRWHSKLGGGHCALYPSIHGKPDRVLHLELRPNEKEVHPTGLVDAFVGSLASSLVDGIPIEDAMPKACFLAAMSTRFKGAAASYIDVHNDEAIDAQLEHFFGEHE